VVTSLEGHSSQRGAVVPTVVPACAAAEPATVTDALLAVAGIAAFEVLAPNAGGVVDAAVAPRVRAPGWSDEIEPLGSVLVVVVDPDVAVLIVGDAARLLAGEPMVWACAAGATQHRQRIADSRAGRCREVDITGGAFAGVYHGPNGVYALAFPDALFRDTPRRSNAVSAVLLWQRFLAKRIERRIRQRRARGKAETAGVLQQKRCARRVGRRLETRERGTVDIP
jgi:hypothetical protein